MFRFKYLRRVGGSPTRMVRKKVRRKALRLFK